MLDKLTIEMFEEQVSRTFLIKVEDTDVEAGLVDCRSLESDAEEGRRKPFSLLFRGPLEPVLPQQIYEVRSEQTELMEIFLVPIGPGKVGMRYEAVFT